VGVKGGVSGTEWSRKGSYNRYDLRKKRRRHSNRGKEDNSNLRHRNKGTDVSKQMDKKVRGLQKKLRDTKVNVNWWGIGKAQWGYWTRERGGGGCNMTVDILKQSQFLIDCSQSLRGKK